jgi:hypothetical protein
MKLRTGMVALMPIAFLMGVMAGELEWREPLMSVAAVVMILIRRLALEDLSLSSAGTWQIIIPAAAFIVLLLRCVCWPALACVRKLRKRNDETGFETRTAVQVWMLSGMLSLLAIVSPLLLLGWMLTGPWSFVPEAAPVSWMLSPLVVAGVCSPLMIALTLIAWRRNFWTLTRRLHFSLIALILTVIIPWLHYWNLPGFLN